MSQRIKILLVEDKEDHSLLISTYIRRIDPAIEVESAATVEEGLQKAAEQEFDLLLSDYRLGPIDCFAMIKDIGRRGVDLPIVILTGEGNEEVAAEAIGRGAQDYLIKDAVFRNPSRLVHSIRSVVERRRLARALRESEELYRTLIQNIHEGVIVLRGDKLEFANPSMESILGRPTAEIEGAAFQALFPPEHRARVTEFLESAWDDHDPHEGEFAMLGSSEGRIIHVTIIVGKCLYRGAPALIGTVKDITERKLAEERLREAFGKLEMLSMTDELTGLFNRRHVLEMLDIEISRSQRFSVPLSMLLIDIDHFKQINDEHGHLLGDRVLKTVSDFLKSRLRAIDTIARYGGDELIIILPQTSLEGAKVIAERLRKAVAELKIRKESGGSVGTTLSIGVSQLKGGGDDINDLIRRADIGLYEAKNKGRNAVEVVS